MARAYQSIWGIYREAEKRWEAAYARPRCPNDYPTLESFFEAVDLDIAEAGEHFRTMLAALGQMQTAKEE